MTRLSAQKVVANNNWQVAIWDVRSFQLVSLLDMLRFHAHSFVDTLANLEFIATTTQGIAAQDEPFDKAELEAVINFLNDASEECAKINLSLSVALIADAKIRLTITSPPTTPRLVSQEVTALQRAVYKELASVFFLNIPAQRVKYYTDEPQFGEKVANKFSKAVTDIQESGKCMATGRYTACVFHLMRVMELAVQYLGRRLNISLVNEKNWHNILDQVDKAIKGLPVKNSRQKAIRNRFSEASAHLRMVKDAWRNDVMHPKETYTEEEAERVFRNTKDFMMHLAIKL